MKKELVQKEDETLETVYIGKNREYKTIQECIFLKGKENLNIFVDEGEYNEPVDLQDAKNLKITGLGKVLISTIDESAFKILNANNVEIDNFFIVSSKNNGFFIYESKNITIKNCIIYVSKKGINITNYSSNIKITNNLLANNTQGISILDSDVILEKNSLINNSIYNLSISSYSSIDSNRIGIFNNVLSLSNIGINSKIQFHLNNRINAKKNLCFLNKINLFKYESNDFSPTIFEFENIDNNDFRLKINKDDKYKDIGASDDLLLKFASISGFESFPKSVLGIKLGVYLNLSIESLIQEYTLFFEQKAKEWELKNLKFINKKEEIDKGIDALLIINALDVNNEPENMFNLIDSCIELNKKCFVFLPSEDFSTTKNKTNLEKMPLILDSQEKLIQNYSNITIFYKDLENLEQQVYEKIFTNNPKITITKLFLENIGHFKKLELNLEDKNCCLIGLNGTGKTTILRAIALALIGNEHKNIIQSNIKNLLQIEGLNESVINRGKGQIKLYYKIDDFEYKNSIEFQTTSDGDVEIKISNGTAFNILNGDYIKSLVIGFTQSRGKNRENLKQRNEVQLPHINDLIPLINNEDDNRLQIFSTWLINLDAKANKEENKALKEKQTETNIKERKIIEKVFAIFSEIMEEDIKFKEVLNNNDVWITTKTNPEGISTDLISQGFQSIIGWIGYFIQRMAEAYPDSKDFTKESSICIIDEIDTYIHPKWQRNIIWVLEKYFENTQFIITTHSPLVISNLSNQNTLTYRVEKDLVIPVFAYGKAINAILFEDYGVTERPKIVQKDIDNLFILLEEEEIEQAKIALDNLKRTINGNDSTLLKAQTMIDILED